MPTQTPLMYQPELLRKDAKKLAQRQSFSYEDEYIAPIQPQLAAIKEELTEAYRLLATSAKQNKEMTPASEWIIDNFYIIQEQIIQVEHDFPMGFQESLPHLTTGPNQGKPRVYGLVQNLAMHTDNKIGIDNIAQYTDGYQEELTLKIGELWATPIMVRFALLKQLTILAQQVVKYRKVRTAIQQFISELTQQKQHAEPGWLLYRIIDWVEEQKKLHGERELYIELIRQLRSAELLTEEEKKWFEYHLNNFGITVDEAIRQESQRQSKLQVSIQNAIVSLRQVSETEWQDFVESCSMVDKILQLDPLGVYEEMDVQTKDQYRDTIERLSRKSNYSEKEVAERVLLLAEQHLNGSGQKITDILDDYTVLKKHVGYYLIGEGYDQLCSQVGYQKPIGERIRKKLEQSTLSYIGIVGIVTCLSLAALTAVTDFLTLPLFVAVSAFFIAIFPALELSISVVNRFFAFWIPPRILPKMDFDERIPASARTMVVIPTLFHSQAEVRELLETLEISSLANKDVGLQFVLLSDFADADSQNKPEDRAIIEEASRGIDQLNEQYSSHYGDKFFILHRERKWNAAEEKWMGWERKRGKLEQLNRVLSNPEEELPFDYIFGDFKGSIQQKQVQYVLTLDADTRTPPDSIRELVEVASHPLNRAWYNDENGRITKGYGIIQPRISIPPDEANKTWFTHIFSGNVGIDPYTTAVSDIYQDLMGEAVYTGKGIYDVRAFYRVLDKRFPENRILSHDLIESNYVRAGLATNIELFDGYPRNYDSFSKRNHRWTRGDWQIARWLFKKVPSKEGKVKNPINLLSRWKIFDNLRRSLNPLFLTLFLIFGWFVVPNSAIFWTLAAIGILAFPIFISFSTDIVNRPKRVKWKLYFERIRSNIRINTIQSVSTLAILPHQAIIQLDAIIRSLWRLNISRKNLLEWTTSFQAEKQSADSLAHYLRLMLGAVVLGIGIMGVSLIIDHTKAWLVIPFGLLWIVSPWFAWYSGGLYEGEEEVLSESEKKTLKTYARRTWFYFEQLVNENYFWLPPDNDQEEPSLPTTARTSPTNIGLTLIATQAAYEFGYITFNEFLNRLENTLDVLSQLNRFRGHFYNWYEIRLGEVLNPRYISTVDSGNLAAGLIVVKQGIKRLFSEQVLNDQYWEGLDVTLRTVKAVTDDVSKKTEDYSKICQKMEHCINDMLKRIEGVAPKTVSESLELLQELKDVACQLCGENLMQLRSALGDKGVEDLQFWLERPLHQIDSYKDELAYFAQTSIDSLKISPAELLEQFEGRDQEEDAFKITKSWQQKVNLIREICSRLISEMDFSFLYLKEKNLFSIGYNVDKAELDKGTYDLLASEARIASLIAIAKGDVPSEHWFRLGRRLTSRNENEFLLSWGGTTFEYLMPQLFIRSYSATLLSHTFYRIIEWQKEYAQSFNRPWGFSESAYNRLNMDLHYQYRSFGVPGLGLKRGLAEEYVVAPYASALALMIEPITAFENLQNLEKLGALGLKGYYDAVDFTPDHLEKGEEYKVVKMYMAHHHGMTLASLLNVLNDWKIRDDFHAEPMIRSCELLLQERIPRGIPVKEPYPIDVEMEPGEQDEMQYIVEHADVSSLDATPPRVHLLSNGSLHSFISHAGTGCTRFNNIRLTGWKADTTEDPLGMFIYIKDQESGDYWSAMHQPVKRKPDRYDSWFHNSKLQTSRVDDWIETTTEICISPENPIELRKVTLTNYSDKPRTLELTSYMEVVLNEAGSHDSHPAFSKLFVQTDYLPEHHAIIAWRRPRSDEETPIYMVHTMAMENWELIDETLEFETERSRFIGRGRGRENPKAIAFDYDLSGSRGNISDPIMSLRRTVQLDAGEKKTITFGVGWAGSRKEAEELADIFDNPPAVERAFDMASIYNTVEQEHLGISSALSQYFQKLAGYVIYPSKQFRAETAIRSSNRKQQPALWTYGISGDFPILVFRIRHTDQLSSLEKALKGHLFWMHRGLQVDFVIINDHPPSYADELQEGIQRIVDAIHGSHHGGGEPNIFTLRSDRIPDEDYRLILTVASIVLEGKLPTIEMKKGDKVPRFSRNDEMPLYEPASLLFDKHNSDKKELSEKLKFYNGFGGFTENGKEYQIYITPSKEKKGLEFPPAPWVNVIGNKEGGFITTEKGAGYSWSKNSRENKLTSWSNDPLLDPVSEAFFIRDEENKEFWSPTPGPTPGKQGYKVSHGFGYSRFEHETHGIESKLVQFVPRKDPVKISLLTLKNNGNSRRNISIFNYTAWVLGIDREKSAQFIVQEKDDQYQAIIAQNWYNNEFADRTAFACIPDIEGKEMQSAFTTDRETFIGRNGSLKRAKAISEDELLDNSINNESDPCAAFQRLLTLEVKEEITFVVLIGEAVNRKQAEIIIDRYSDIKQAREALQKVKSYWQHRLGRVQVQTPDQALNILMNGWLQYQNIVCRMWSRTGFYQAGGAFGFRDQLQDSMAALYVDPQMTRDQILLHASRQFKKGDVQHWWHPPTGRGIRSRITDDRLWLPYVVDYYIKATGDTGLLEENIPYLKARELEDDEHEAYLHPEVMSGPDGEESLYHHCIRAIDVTLQMGEHGLPLIGGGDWNDGMNRVGHGGKGESVWLGFFLYSVLKQFKNYAEIMGAEKKARDFDIEAEKLKQHLNKEGWDGKWYRRAFYDDGTPLGSVENDECKIDAIAQAWSIISGVATSKKAEKALSALDEHLVSESDRIIRLLTPPFDQTEKDPGYIKGYIPGVRENGGQYTHAAIWAIKAFAKQGYGDKAVSYLSMINPVNHSSSKEDVARYKVEPYAVAADIYGEPPLTGQGGWTWYTGSAGWMYQVALESILGITIEPKLLVIEPAIASYWQGYEVEWKRLDSETIYHIKIINDQGIEQGLLRGTIDGREVQFPGGKAEIKLTKDGKEHNIELKMVAR
ncbi:GH36-type glycosyl hydrolase domain-containing protein [Fodinibius saliphilus]|uniref:GH36-type glycosyl hydrolase domain-containing protein n=1 Tax=Fodinibius saliphilus TaxID=1920650 RepID=UPI001108EFBA|nr:glucoamylase family protein [Fodinibius saliphilus]